MSITVVICTWNRSALLDATMSGMRNLLQPTGTDWQLLVVDNASTDDTQRVLSRHAADLPVRVIIEERQGLSHARNCAVEHCDSEWMIFTDDDVQVSPRWLIEYWQVMQEAAPSVGLLGGPVEPWFEIPPDQDLVEAIPTVGRGFCGIETPKELRIDSIQDRLPVGANFAIRRTCLGDRRFNPRLGLRGKDRIQFEELELMRGLVQAGIVGQWVPGAMVKHFVPAHRLALPYLTRHLFDQGRTRVRRYRIAEGASRVAPWVYRDVAESAVLMAFWWACRRRRPFLERLSRLCLRGGMVVEQFFGARD